MTVGRFAPSPTGRMHAGNVFAALMAWLIARKDGGEIVLRIEDLDRERSHQEYIDALMRDLEFLGLTWDRGPFFQSTRAETYREIEHDLEARGFLYPCFCSRADTHASSAPHAGEKSVYAGICRHLTRDEVAQRQKTRSPAIRISVPDEIVSFDDIFQGKFEQNLLRDCGDFLTRRSDKAYAYQFAVVIDDAEQGVDSVARGCDLLDSTPQQIFLQKLLGYTHPTYAHIPLVMGEPGRRLSKRDHNADLGELLAQFKTAERLLGYIAGLTGIAPDKTPISAEELLEIASFEALQGNKTILWT